ncbi:MAG: PIG-L family deacetylase [Rhodospirillales bacterium]|nr:PIG-L family deacetylase [Rhodospirillales bacterium]
MTKSAGAVLAGLAALPELEAHIFLSSRRPLILAPHPDDESLGCGGLIAAACALGLAPVVVILTDGAASHPGSSSYPPARLRAVRRAEARDALKLLGVPSEQMLFLDYPDGNLPRPEGAGLQLLDQLAAITKRWACGLLLAPWEEDPHCDHKAAAKLGAALAASCKLELWHYSVWGWLLPREALVQAVPLPGWRILIENYLPLKRKAIAAHSSQHGELITDSAQAFVLPEALLAISTRRHEVYFPA